MNLQEALAQIDNLAQQNAAQVRMIFTLRNQLKDVENRCVRAIEALTCGVVENEKLGAERTE